MLHAACSMQHAALVGAEERLLLAHHARRRVDTRLGRFQRLLVLDAHARFGDRVHIRAERVDEHRRELVL